MELFFGLQPLACQEQHQSCPRCTDTPGVPFPGLASGHPPPWPWPRARPSRFPSPCLALPPGVERASPHGASARPWLLAASLQLPEHAPPIYRQGPPPIAISVSCQLPAAHSGRRSREPVPELSPRAGRERREPACLLSSPSCPPSALPHSGSRELGTGRWSNAPLGASWACGSGPPGSARCQECPGRMRRLPKRGSQRQRPEGALEP